MPRTDLKISEARPQEKLWSVADGGGHMHMDHAVGGTLWRWPYRFEGGERLISFRRYPEVSFAKAREKHAEARKLLAERIDPMAQRKVARSAQSVATENSRQPVAAWWLERWRKGKSPRHAEYARKCLESDVYPVIGARIISYINAREIFALVQKIQKRIARDEAKRALETVRQIFRLGIAHGHCVRNPTTEIRQGDILRSSSGKN